MVRTLFSNTSTTQLRQMSLSTRALLQFMVPGLPKPSFVKVLGAPKPQEPSGSVGAQTNVSTLTIEEQLTGATEGVKLTDVSMTTIRDQLSNGTIYCAQMTPPAACSSAADPL